MRKLVSSILGLSLFSLPAVAEPTKGYYTMDAMGCMILRECTDDVKQVKSIQDISDNYTEYSFDGVSDEFNSMVRSLDKIGVNVFLGNVKYFPPGHRGVYHTVGNNFFLNKAFMHRPSVLMSVMRHEGWHAAQDCMAGTIDNSLIAIILPEESVPPLWRAMTEKTYPSAAVPWEAEATWAGKTEGMTMKALDACASGKMWEVYEPTPLTKKFLVEEGFISK